MTKVPTTPKDGSSTNDFDVSCEIAEPLEDDSIADVEVAAQGGFERYFEQTASKSKTSNNTLAKLPQLSQLDCVKLLNSYVPPYAQRSLDLVEAHEGLFEEWCYELEQGYSVCLYGFGSKRSLLQKFAEKECVNEPYMIVNGYHPKTDVKTILSTLSGGLGSGGSSLEYTMAAITDAPYDAITLIIHNIDGQGLRSDRAQSVLSSLAAHEKVRLICSIDHINAPLLWDTDKMLAYKFLFHDATTYLPYSHETSLLHGWTLKGTTATLTGDRGVKWVLQTLSQNAQEIFKILLSEQIQTGEAVETIRLYEKAANNFVVSNMQSYQSLLGEFVEHEIIVRAQESGIGETLRIPFHLEELRQLATDICDSTTGA